MVRFVIGHSWEVGGRSVKELTKHVPWDFRSPPCISGSCSPFRLEAEQPRSAGHLARLHCSASVCPSLENDSSLTVPFDFHIYQKKRQQSEQRYKSFWDSLTMHPSKQQMFVLEHEDLMPNETRGFQVPHSCFVHSGTQRSDIHITPSNALHKWTLRVAQSLVLFNAILTSIDLAASLHVYRRQTNTKDDLISWTFDPCTNDGSKRADVRAAYHRSPSFWLIHYVMRSQTLWVSCKKKTPWKLVRSALGRRNGNVW